MAETGCSAYVPNNAPCPIDLEEILKSSCARFPRGWAWEGVDIEGTNIFALNKAWSYVVKDLQDRACELLPEFQCNTTSELTDAWNADYGLPDDCGINDLCAKVAATGGANCEYFAGLAESLGYTTTCCEDVETEIQAGCWNLGCQPCPPKHEFEKGGSYLGYAMLACKEENCGTNLGVDVHNATTEDCNVTGYYECDPVTTEAGSICQTSSDCAEYVPASVGTLITGCYEAYELNYTGTAYQWRFGIPNDLGHFLGIGAVPPSCIPNDGLCEEWCMGQTPLGTFDPGVPPVPGDFAIMGCWETGCTPLCSPDASELLCFISLYKPAHTVASAYWCEET